MKNNIIPVLKLDDDNHSPCYVTRDDYYSDVDCFMSKALCKPHSTEFKIKEIRLIYLNENLIHDNFTMLELFDKLDNFDFKNMSKERSIERENAFDYFWNTNLKILYGKNY